MGDCTRVLLTGASGYIGGRLATRLLERGYSLRCLVREPRKISHRPWARDPGVEIVGDDLTDIDATTKAMEGCGPAYYLVHSMIAAGRDYAERDLATAERFAQAATRAGLTRIIYLGGLGELGPGLSEHLTSRRQVEYALHGGRVPVTVLRAAMIIGSGSASFEILRYLVERLPVMLAPRWVETECQPISIRNVLGYLVDCLSTPATTGRTLDIGGLDVLTYAELMGIMAEELRLRRRRIIPLPGLTPGVSALWIHLLTPLSGRIARPLAEGLRNRVVCRSDAAQRLMPQPLLGVREAIRLALARLEAEEVETAWSDAGPVPGDPDWSGGTVYTDQRQTEVRARPCAVFRTVCRIGGRNGWYAADGLWGVRGWMDRLVGGPGLRRGRRNPERIAYGDVLDFWRVTAVELNRRLALRGEMKLPGEAFLEFRMEPLEADAHGPRTALIQTARFRPRGLLGLAYWCAVQPVHGIVFSGMIEGIRQAAEGRPAPQPVVSESVSATPHRRRPGPMCPAADRTSITCAGCPSGWGQSEG
jgi:uncharacterized protein YbjT (DUF2867 family)